MQDSENGQLSTDFLDQWEKHYAAFVALKSQPNPDFNPISADLKRELSQWAA